MLPEITDEKINGALREFDLKYRNSQAWQDWEQNRAFKYALRHKSLLYPPKKIASLATGLPVSQFSGGDQTNDYLRSHGLEIIPLARSHETMNDEPGSALSTAIQRILDTYRQSRAEETFGRDSSVWPQFEGFEIELKSVIKSLNRPDLTCYWRAGQGKFTAVPFMAIMDRRETLSTQRGVYCVFLFREDMTGVYLTLNQGATELVEEFGRSQARETLRARARELKEKIADVEERDFELGNSIDLRSKVARAIDYECGTVASKFYAARNLPGDRELRLDIDCLTYAYQRIVLERARNVTHDQRSWIFQANPDYYDIDRALAKLTRMSWLVKQHVADIHADDQVFIWRSGDEAGVVAVATIITDPQEFEMGPEEAAFSAGSKVDLAGRQMRVQLQIHRRISISRSRIRENPQLQDLSILKAPQGTNFAITSEHAAAILAMSEETPLSDSEESHGISPLSENKRIWLFAPGRNAERWDELYRDGLMAIGWDDIGDLTAFDTISSLADRMAQVYEKDSQPTNDARTCWDFAHTIRPGDIVFVKRGRNTIIGYGIVTGDYQHELGRRTFRNVRAVRWERRGEWPYSGSLAIKTLTDITPDPSFVTGLKQLIELEPKDPTSAAVPQRALTPYTIEEAASDLFLDPKEMNELVALWRRKKNLILQGPPGVGKTFLAKRLAFLLMGYRDPARIGMVQFHQSYSYEDFVQGYRPGPSGFVRRDGLFFTFCREAAKDPESQHVFIIDEINRGNLSKIFGELMMLIEADKRGSEWSIPLSYSNTIEEEFYVPSNVYIVGLMNTADRSLSMVDYALRRRFAFVSIKPGFKTAAFSAFMFRNGTDPTLIDRVVSTMTALNQDISDDQNLGDGFLIGHSFFCDSHECLTAEVFKNVIRTEVIPLLREYWFDDPDRVKRWEERLLVDD